MCDTQQQKRNTQTHRANEAMWMPVSAQSADKVIKNWLTAATAFWCKMLKIISPEHRKQPKTDYTPLTS